MDKELLRKRAIERQQNMSKEEKSNIEMALCEKLTQTDLWKQSDVIGVTVSMPLEWNTTSLIEAAWKEKKVVTVPKTIKEGKQLMFYKLNDFDELEQSAYGILEPKETGELVEKNEIELLVVPGLLFDKRGYRIGFGGGYYDRFLNSFRNKTVSLCSERQLLDELPAEVHDIPVQYVVTENNLFRNESVN